VEFELQKCEKKTFLGLAKASGSTIKILKVKNRSFPAR
jgi:hypothetical protein